MQQRFHLSAPARKIGVGALTVVMVAALAACGGGGGGSATATVTSMSIDAKHYGQTATITINGTNLDGSLSVSSAACTNMTRLSSGSTVSSSTSAFYSCTVDGALTGTVSAVSNGGQVGSATFTVPSPQVTMAVNNGAGVNGIITVTLRPDVAPRTVDNFLNYVNTKFYDGTIFHRIVPGFIMQGGGYAAPVTNLATATPKTGLFAPIAIESTGLKNVQWSIAMANANTLSDEVTPTTTSQFYFNVNAAANTQLDGHYAVFGSITTGIDVAQTILAAPADCQTSIVDTAGDTETDCLPDPNVKITSATQSQ